MDYLAQLLHSQIAFYLYLLALTVVAVWESFRPARTPVASIRTRWLNNFTWFGLNTGLHRLITPILIVGLTLEAQSHFAGLLQALKLPELPAFFLGILILDAAGYGLHVFLHRIPWLWRLHAVHHSDIDFDFTTGYRFHPLEGLVAILVRVSVIVLFGVPAIAVLFYEFWVGLQNLYGHANASLPSRVERIARKLVVTPDMHRVHHSIDLAESNTNFGIVLPWWDHLFRTYKTSSKFETSSMPIGLDWLRSETWLSLPKLVYLPFRRSFPSGN